MTEHDQQLFGCHHQPAIVETPQEREARRERQAEVLASSVVAADVSAQASADYPRAKWVGAYWQNYTIPRSRIKPTYIAIHAMLGSLAGTRSWFNDPSNPYDTSCQYGVGLKGEVEQYVREAHYAHHVRGFNEEAIGIEHEDLGQYQKKPWTTEALYNASAKLCAYLCEKWGIPIDREHIKAHIEFPGNDHKDPNPYWDWKKYIALVKKYAGESGGGIGPWASWVNLAVDSGPDEKIAEAAETALKTVGFSKVDVTQNVTKAFDDGLKGALGEFPCMIVGRTAWEALPANYQNKALSDARRGVWYSPDASDLWNAVGATEAATSVLVAGHLARLCKRMGLDETKCMKAWSEELTKLGTTPAPVPDPMPDPKPEGPPRAVHSYVGLPRYSEAELVSVSKRLGLGQKLIEAIPHRYQVWREAVLRGAKPENTPAPDAQHFQSVDETGKGIVEPTSGRWQRSPGVAGDSGPYNLCGLNKGSGVPNAGPQSFERPATARRGVETHFNHGSVYTGNPVTVGVPHGRYSVAKKVRFGKAPVRSVDGLTGSWAMNPRYAAQVKAAMDQGERILAELRDGAVVPAPSIPGIRTLLTVEEGFLGLAFGDPSSFQGTHKGWDVWPRLQSVRARLFAPLPGRIIEVRDFGSVSGFAQALQVRYDNGIVQQSGHLKAGISKRWKVGMRFEAGQELAEIGTASDGKGIRHAHIEIFLDEGAALRYDHSKALNPAGYRDDFGETGPVPRVMGFASEVAAGADEEMLAAGLSLVDVPCGC